MRIWPWTRKHSGPSPAAMAAVRSSHLDLDYAKRQRVEAHELSTKLSASQDVNHYAIALAATLRHGRDS